MEGPRGFLRQYASPVVLDEIQSLLPYIQELVYAHREGRGQFLPTGPQNVMMAASVTEPLAGRQPSAPATLGAAGEAAAVAVGDGVGR